MNKLRKFREAQMLTKTELARKAGLSVLTVHRIEQGRFCRETTQRKILLALGLGLSHMFDVFPEQAGVSATAATAREALIPAREMKLEGKGMFSGLRVLVVDDDESVRDLLTEQLGFWGCQVHLAATGEEGVERYRHLGADLVIIGLEAPARNGFDASRDIMELDPHASIILTTGSRDRSLARKALERALVRVVIPKPFYMDQLELAIQEAIRKKRPQEVLPTKKGVVA
jgi:CheY-like chemotaxis protein/DNA-binding XRE family transcriptional regulator